jgi:hypothetical protein
VEHSVPVDAIELDHVCGIGTLTAALEAGTCTLDELQCPGHSSGGAAWTTHAAPPDESVYVRRY